MKVSVACRRRQVLSDQNFANVDREQNIEFQFIVIQA